MKKAGSILIAVTLALVFIGSLVSAASAASVTPTDISSLGSGHSGNATAADAGYPSPEYFSWKAEGSGHNPPADGNYQDGTYYVEWTITDGKYLSFMDAAPTLCAVIVKGGNGANLYEYSPSVSADNDLVSPLKNGKLPDISHVIFIWRVRTEPQISTLMYTLGTDLLVPDDSQLAPGAQIYDTAVIVPDTATGTVDFFLYNQDDVVVFSSLDRPLSSGLAVSETCGSLEAGSYHWQAVYSGDDLYCGFNAAPEPFTVTEMPVNPVPELPTVALLGLGICGIGAVIVLGRQKGLFGLN